MTTIVAIVAVLLLLAVILVGQGPNPHDGQSALDVYEDVDEEDVDEEAK